MEFTILIITFFSGAALTWLAIFNFYIKGRYSPLSDLTKLDKEYYLLDNQYNAVLSDLQKLEKDYELLKEKEQEQVRSFLLAQKEVENLKQKSIEIEQEQVQSQIKLQEQFELLSNRIFIENTQNLNKIHSENLSSILNPLKEKIEAFEKKVEESSKSQLVDNNLLKHEIKRLAELNLQIGEEAKNLAQALKGDNKAAGAWGEVVLERILESSGLKLGKEYVLQGKNMFLKNEEGSFFKPDVVILLPDEKHLIIDSKVSLKAYEAFSNCSQENEKEHFLKLHINSLKSHIKGLSEKYYHALPSLKSPDFVLLFIPVEACFSSAFQSGTFDLFSYAWERKVIIVSPTTLFATLRTVASIWKYENQNRNALHIAEESGKLYDKLFSFVEDMDKVGKGLATSQQAFDDAYKKLSFGKGNILSKAEKIKSMGINSKKSLSTFLAKGELSANISGEEGK